MATLTTKELRAIAVLQKYQTSTLLEELDEYYHLLDTLIYVNEVLSEVQHVVASWEKYSETLLMKFTYHGYTLHDILSGTAISSSYYPEDFKGAGICDVSSGKSILRSQLETFLMYHYIFVNPSEASVKEFRFSTWVYTALLQRQSYPSMTEFAKGQKLRDQEEIKKFQADLKNNAAFHQLTAKQQNGLLTKGSAKSFNYWENILTETGFDKSNHFIMMYTMLSIYAHSEALSILQLESGKSDPLFENKQGKLDLFHSKLLVCLMILSITKLYTPCQQRYDLLPQELRWDIELYAMIGKAPGLAPLH